MITSKSKNFIGLILKAGIRKAGKMDVDGKEISWSEGYQIVALPLEDESGKIRKFIVEPSCVDKISQQLDSIHWAALIEIELQGRNAIAIEVLDDVLNDFYEQ